jgi:hypothetical protein
MRDARSIPLDPCQYSRLDSRLGCGNFIAMILIERVKGLCGNCVTRPSAHPSRLPNRARAPVRARGQIMANSRAANEAATVSVRYRFRRKIGRGLELEAARLAGPDVAHAAIAYAFRPRGGYDVGGAIRTEMKWFWARAVNAWCPVQTIHGTSSIASPTPVPQGRLSGRRPRSSQRC